MPIDNDGEVQSQPIEAAINAATIAAIAYGNTLIQKRSEASTRLVPRTKLLEGEIIECARCSCRVPNDACKAACILMR
jgi:hypothetical protein